MAPGIHTPPLTTLPTLTAASDSFAWVIFLIFFVVAGIGSLYAWTQEKKRRQEKADLAARLGLAFHPGVDHSHDDLFQTFEIFRRGHSRCAMNTMTGRVELGGRSFACRMGDYRYKITTGTGKSRRTTTYRFSYCALDLPFGPVPNMLIRPEGLFDKLTSVFGSRDIEMESAEFNKRFHVQSTDRRFAYDVCHPRMMEFLLQNPGPTVDIERGRCCLADGRKRWSVGAFEDAVRWADGFFAQWPRHLLLELEQQSRTMQERRGPRLNIPAAQSQPQAAPPAGARLNVPAAQQHRVPSPLSTPSPTAPPGPFGGEASAPPPPTPAPRPNPFGH